MDRLEKLKKDVESLSPAEFAELGEWFRQLDNDEWDRQIEEDSKAGRRDVLTERALADYRAGRTTEL